MTATLAEVLNEAIAYEYKARDTYRAIIDRFGPVKPFINIVEAEQTHIDALLTLFARYDIPVPSAPDPARILPPDTPLDGCREGIEAELQNVAMYDRLLGRDGEGRCADGAGEAQGAASRDHHLPAFRRCVERSGAMPAGRGGGGRGRGFGGGRGQGRGRRGLGRRGC
jgi:hypothetical protein